MSEHDSFKNIDADPHGTKHEAIAPNGDSEESDIDASEITHADQGHDHHHHEESGIEGRSTMKTKVTAVLAGLAVLITLATSQKINALAITISANEIPSVICNSPATIEATKEIATLEITDINRGIDNSIIETRIANKIEIAAAEIGDADINIKAIDII